MKSKNICIIPARAGSKGIKYKNLSKICGDSLIKITINQAKMAKVFDRIFISTESKKIINSFKNDIETPFLRPPHLAEDNIHVSKVIVHALQEFQNMGLYYDNVVMLMPTSPLRTSKNIAEAVKMFSKSDAESLVSVVNTNKLETNLRYLNKDGSLQYFNKSTKRNINRQNVKPLYAVNGSIYIAKIPNFLKTKTFHTKNVIGYEMPEIESVDINTKEDLELAQIIFESRNK